MRRIEHRFPEDCFPGVTDGRAGVTLTDTSGPTLFSFGQVTY
jgi:hypothetical protein